MEENKNIDITKIHAKWQKKWEENKIYKVDENN
jgi:leucyl-tRNA synthetase